jgi:hypothetical protein
MMPADPLCASCGSERESIERAIDDLWGGTPGAGEPIYPGGVGA